MSEAGEAQVEQVGEKEGLEGEEIFLWPELFLVMLEGMDWTQ